MSRKRSPAATGILLDTSFLLPILGFDTSERGTRAFGKLASLELYYSDVSLLEASWKIVKVIKGTEEELKAPKPRPQGNNLDNKTRHAR